MHKPTRIAMLAGAAAIIAVGGVTACQTAVMPPGSRNHGRAGNHHLGHITPGGPSRG